MATRKRDAANRRSWLIGSFAVIAVATALIFFTFDGYGMSWDQASSYRYGLHVRNFYTSGGNDLSAVTVPLHDYGGLFELTDAAVERITGLDWFSARTLNSTLFGLLGLFAILRCGWVIYGPPVGVTAAVLLLLTPLYYGQQFINPKDIPFAALTTLAIRYIAELVAQFPKSQWSTNLKGAAAIGAAMGVRVGGLQLFGVLGIGLLAAAWQERGNLRAIVKSNWRAWLVQGPTVLALAWIVMLAVWPFALVNPISGPIAAMKEFSRLEWSGRVFYEGQLLRSDDLPWTYIPHLLLLTMPEVVLLGLAAGPLAIASTRRKGQQGFSAGQRSATTVIVAAVVLPVLSIWILRVPIYDGIRHVLFIVPPLILLSALGYWICVPRLPNWGVSILVAIAFLLAVATAFEMRVLHPYEYIYFNRAIAGGLPKASSKYDHDYWATGMREAAEWVSQHYNPTPGEEIKYTSSASAEQVDLFLHPPPESGAIFRRAERGAHARLHFVMRRYRQNDEWHPGRTIYSVEREGVPLVDIIETP